MGGQRILVNPNLEGVEDFPPEKVHQLVDYVVITSKKQEFMHGPTVSKMNLAKTNFVACSGAGEVLSTLMVRNLAVLASGPDGRAVLSGREGSADVAIFVAPGSSSWMPWQELEVGFIFANMETRVAVGYEASGQYLGQGASSDREGIPEEAYQIDYLVTPDLREAADVAKGLTEKGTVLRGVVALPGLEAFVEQQEDPNPVVGSLLALDRTLDAALGGIAETPSAFKEFLAKQGPPLSEARLFVPTAAGEAVELE